ncbi:hypothetical protein ColKHC_04655 [Colletotrichum higginsianum]|nr:hypothetical protein ColKHC_04655 [Colletotrichum higginsianum]
MGMFLTSSMVQYRRIFSAPSVLTSWSRCVHSTPPQLSIFSLSTASSSSVSRDRHRPRYSSKPSSPRWISLCWRSSSARPARNSGIRRASMGNTGGNSGWAGASLSEDETTA